MNSVELTCKPTTFPLQGQIAECTRANHPEIVYLVDSDEGFREGLSELLEANGRRVVSFRTGSAFFAWRRADSASCLILDMVLPDMCGLDLQSRLSTDDNPPAIFISRGASIESTVLAMKRGAFEFFTKPVSTNVLEAAVDAALAHDRQRRRLRSEITAIRQRFAALTPREQEVLPLIVGGLLNKQAAVALGISEATVQVRRGQIMRKMGVRSFAQLVRMAEKIRIQRPAERAIADARKLSEKSE